MTAKQSEERTERKLGAARKETPEQMLAAISQEEQNIVLKEAVKRAYKLMLREKSKFERAEAVRAGLMADLKKLDMCAALDLAIELNGGFKKEGLRRTLAIGDSQILKIENNKVYYITHGIERTGELKATCTEGAIIYVD